MSGLRTSIMHGRTGTAAILLAVLAVGLISGWWLAGIHEPALTTAPPLPAPPAPEGLNGLSDRERSTFYHLSEGGELFPVDLVLALEQETSDSNGTVQMRPFLDNIERYGLLPDPKRPGNEEGLPVGVSLGRSKVAEIDMIGLNCAACHVGQVQYRGHSVRIDGLGNMVLVNAFLRDIALETTKTIESPRRLERFWRNLREGRTRRRAQGKRTGIYDRDERALQRIIGLFTKNRGLLEAQANDALEVPALRRALSVSTQEGYGRLDAFGIGRDELFGREPGTSEGNNLPADAPVSLPHIWGIQYTGWLQWGASTNSVMERNLGQSLGVGTLFNRETYESSARIDNLHRMERFAYKLTPPEWPASFPAIAQARATRGKALFVQHCAECHEQYTTDGAMRIYRLFPLNVVGTDPLTAIDFELPVKLADGTARPFPYAALDLITRIKVKAYQDAGYTPEQISELEERQIRKGPQWDPTFRAPLLDSAKYADTAGRAVYRAKSLVGIWATGPFLHNGSVPTVYDLLLPAAERPVTFQTGTREYDPIRLGIQTNLSMAVLAPGQAPFTFDTRLPGNWNSGHEWDFYPSLTDDQRYDIIEFLKTFTSESQLPAFPGKPATAAPAATPATMLFDQPRRPRHDAGPAIAGGRLVFIDLAVVVVLAGGLWIGGMMMPRGEEARATEADDTATLTRNILMMQRRYAVEQNRPLARGTHAKGMCVRGRFEVYDLFQTIPDRALACRLAQGLFAKPGIYDATVRFANADSHIFPDPRKDVRACSIAVEAPAGVLGPDAMRQDFSMNNAPVFPLNDAHAFALTTRVALAPTTFGGWLSLAFRDKMEFLRVAFVAAMQTKPATVAFQQMRYWSTVPFHHGPADVIKYGAFACPGNYAQPLSPAINCLQDELARHVNDDLQMSCFDFGLQLLDADTMTYFGRHRTPAFWIENATVRWKETQVPFHIVGRLTLVARSVFPAEAVAKMSIDVTTNSAPDSKPMGGINRARPVAEGASRHARFLQGAVP
jgi:hypothetical protein